jgi:hypothetical protein
MRIGRGILAGGSGLPAGSDGDDLEMCCCDRLNDIGSVVREHCSRVWTADEVSSHGKLDFREVGAGSRRQIHNRIESRQVRGQ